MFKAIAGFIVGIPVIGLGGWAMMPHLMFTERVSPFGMEETVARIQHNIQNSGNGWALSGLRNPAKAVQGDGGNVLPVMMIEATPRARATGPAAAPYFCRPPRFRSRAIASAGAWRTEPTHTAA